MSDHHIQNPAYRIETERLIVRCYEPGDAQMLTDSISESVEHLKPWMPWAHAEPVSAKARVAHLQKFRGMFDLQQDYVYAILNKDESRLLGGTGLHTRLGPEQLEIGYWIHQDFANQGLVTEATAALVKVAFELIHVHRIEIHCDPRNLASASIPRKLGFTHEGTLRSKMRFLDHWIDSMIWGLVEEEYSESPSCSTRIRVYDARGLQLL